MVTHGIDDGEAGPVPGSYRHAVVHHEDGTIAVAAGVPATGARGGPTT